MPEAPATATRKALVMSHLPADEKRADRDLSALSRSLFGVDCRADGGNMPCGTSPYRDLIPMLNGLARRAPPIRRATTPAGAQLCFFDAVLEALLPPLAPLTKLFVPLLSLTRRHMLLP